MKLTSNFASGHQIPEKYTCTGEDISPPFTFDDVPAEAQSLVIVMQEDSGEGIVHWLLYNIPAATKWMAEGDIPEGAVEGLCTNNTIGYGGPCPQYFKGQQHYRFKLYALDVYLQINHGADFKLIKTQMEGHILNIAELKAFCPGD